MKKYKLVLDVLEDATWQIDVRDNHGKSIGHIMLSGTGVSWKKYKGKEQPEVAWSNVMAQLAK